MANRPNAMRRLKLHRCSRARAIQAWKTCGNKRRDGVRVPQVSSDDAVNIWIAHTMLERSSRDAKAMRFRSHSSEGSDHEAGPLDVRLARTGPTPAIYVFVSPADFGIQFY